MLGGAPVKALASPEIAHTIWEQNVELADKANEPGKFTAFCSYEWTSMPNNMNLHRNVFFKDCAHVPAMPFSSLDSTDPTDLWTWMDGQRKAGNELLAISHNANLSDGRMYPTDVDLHGRPIDKAYAESRMRNEPLIEIKQIKGQSETHPLLSPNDEFANFEILTYLLGDPAGRIPHVIGSYARQALKDGLALEDTKGFNPYRFGFGAASDSHDTGVPYRQDNFFGAHGIADGTIETRMSGHLFAGLDVRMEGTAGLTGVWAEENTRESIFNAMKRKETFAVSGPHIKVRFFGGWNYAETATAEQRRAFWKFVPDWIKDRDWVKAAYAQGVPMGGDLTPMPAGDKAPSFAVWAVKDPTSGNLDRIQIIKGWTKSGQSFEKVFDVAWAGDREPDKWTGRRAADRKHGRRRKGHLHEQHRRRRIEDRVDRSRVRSERSGVLLRPRARDSDAALDDDPGRATRHRAARRGGGNRPGAGVEFPDLVQPDRRGAENRQGWSHRRRSQEAGGSRAQRCSAEGADRRQVPVAAEQRHRHEVQDHL